MFCNDECEKNKHGFFVLWQFSKELLVGTNI